jgi:L-lactate dehydrogenase
MDAVAAAARNAKPRPGVDRIRLPGERGLAHYRDALAHGVPLYPKILPALAEWAERYGVALPPAIEE